MGLILDARCGRCDFARSSLRLGATMVQMSGERRSALHLFRCSSCKDVASVEVFLGEPPGEARCDRCTAALAPSREAELRIATLRGERLSGHTCPRCGEAALAFLERGKFS